MSNPRSVVVTVAFGHATEKLDYTFSSFSDKNPGLALHAFILGEKLPERRLPQIQYHLISPMPDFSDPLREVYFRRLELLDRLEADYALVVDCYDVLCLRPLPSFAGLLGGGAVAACVEHMGARYVMGQGYTANFLNGGVFLWDIAASRVIRSEVCGRGRSRFRTIADDQHCLNEVILTKHYDRLRILPCQYNYRAYLNRKQRGWPTVTHLDGVVIYHNATCMDEAKKLTETKAKAVLPNLVPDGHPLNPKEQFWRRLRQRLQPWIIK